MAMGRRSARHVPIRRPFPYIARHVEQTVAVRQERADRCRAFISIGEEVLPRKVALPRVGSGLAIWLHLLAPHERGADEPTARRILPLRFRWQTLSSPARIRFGVLE